MIKSVKAKNFRCFENIELRDLRRINVVVGRNAAGKTALLELLRLALGATPQVALALNQYRGIQFYMVAPTSREQFEAQWNWLFFAFNPKNTIETTIEDSAGHKATLRVYYDAQKAVTPNPQPGQPSLIATIVPLSFDRTDFSGQSSQLLASVGQQGQFLLDQGPELGLATEFFASSWFLNSQQNVLWFSQLSVDNREKEVIAAIRREFSPLVDDLQVLALGGPIQAGAIYASVPFLASKIPLSLMSAGITKFFTILSVILYRSRGVVLIDELENGVYYDRLPALWETIFRLAKQCDTQIFVSTHSNECLQALRPTIDQHASEFMLLRAERNNGASGIFQFEGREFEAALAKHGEVR